MERARFFGLLSGDTEVNRYISKVELEGIFDYGYFLRHVDAVFERLGLKG